MNGDLNGKPARLRLAISIGFAVTMIEGCSSARVVSQQESSGVIAIPANTDMWPFRYRSKAEALLAQQCPEGYVIELEEEYVTGQSTNVQEDRREDEHQISKRASFTVGSTSTNTTTTDVKEWRIHYRKKEADEERSAQDTNADSE